MDHVTAFGFSAPSVIACLVPKSKDWQEIAVPRILSETGYPIRAFWHVDNYCVFSAVESIMPEGGTEARPEYHLSMSYQPRGVPARVKTSEAKWILRQFSMEGAFEDNHVPHGKVRNFWRPVAAALVGQVCPCVDDEPTITEDQGEYVWRGDDRLV